MTLIDDITPSDDERIYGKLKHITFCRCIIYYSECFKRDGFAYINRLAKVLKTTYPSAYTATKLLENVSLVRLEKKASNFIEVLPTMEGNPPLPKIYKYVSYAKKTLGLE